jgi:hypothetical protein
MASKICLIFLFVVSITCENVFVCLLLIPMLLGVFVIVINVVEGGANTRNAIGMVERFTIEGAC